MTIAEGDDVPQAFVLDGTNEPFSVCVQVWAVRGQPQHLHARGLQDAPEVGRVERVSVDDQVAEARQRTGHGVGEVASGLGHPVAVSPAGDAGDMNATRLEVAARKYSMASPW
jgi:hypothetical protein